MSNVLASLQSGDWITRERARLWALAILVASLGGIVYLLATSDGLNDFKGRPLGTDFSNIYAGGTYALEGKAGLAFDPPLQHAREQAIFGTATPFYGWCYPPFLLFVSAVLALMPYTTALAVWQGSTLLLYLAMLWAVLRSVQGRPEDDASAHTHDPLWILLAVASPAVFVNLGHGHNGFLTATLLGMALVVLDRRPIARRHPVRAAVLQAAVRRDDPAGADRERPLAHVRLRDRDRARARRSRRRSFSARMSGARSSLPCHVTREVVLEARRHRLAQDPDRVLLGAHVGRRRPARLCGPGRGHARARRRAGLAVAQRGGLSAEGRSADHRRRSSATPYSLDYDFVVLAPAIAFLAADGFARGFAPWEKTALALLWLMPLIARTVAEQALIPLGVPSMLLVFVLILRRAAGDLRASLPVAIGGAIR